MKKRNMKSRDRSVYWVISWVRPWKHQAGPAAVSMIAALSVMALSSHGLCAERLPYISAGMHQTLGLRTDGTVVAAGLNTYGQCNVDGWGDIVQVAAGFYHSLALKSDGTVTALGRNDQNQCRVEKWADMVQVSAGLLHSVGVKSDGTVAAEGFNAAGQCNVGEWSDIVQASAGYYHTVGLKGDGTVVAVGYCGIGQCDVASWTNTVQVVAGFFHTVGLGSDGTVRVAGNDSRWQFVVDSWTDIVQTAVGFYHTVGLKADGTVVAEGQDRYGQCQVGSWTDIVQVAAGFYHTVGLKADGTVVTAGYNGHGQLQVEDWRLLMPPEIAFTADPDVVAFGGESALSWSVSHAQGVSIDNGVGAVAPVGSMQVRPTHSTTYTLTATGHDGQPATGRVTVQVEDGYATGGVFSVDGAVGIGTRDPQTELAVNGTITAREVRITQAGWADHVFDSGYRLMPLADVAAFIQANGHLPDIPSGSAVEQNGLPVADMLARQMRKIEELTLYILRMEKENRTLSERMSAMENGCAKGEKP